MAFYATYVGVGGEIFCSRVCAAETVFSYHYY